MSRNHVGNLGEGAGRLVSKRTKITEGKEGTSAVTGRDRDKDCRQKDGFWCREHQTTRKCHKG